ncbi:MAG: hybrid sensor histidine kinase/response regulator [Candidatus Obscuribacter sp.]|jgi:signal transduction histidine kinase|nr:hybrid sensor histidine kinase/response regulator [Candidatus Obscuribacter sp.]MBK9769524.1 hybrid sensor histidine kinase/response regulator [Candidatus Obscuribacter sp.]
MPITKSLSILIIEDNDPDARYVQEILPRENYTFVHKHSLKEALSCDEQDYDLILLDLTLPDGQGLATFETLNKAIKSKPIVILTGLNDEVLANDAVKLGAQDYILKQEMSEYILTRTIGYAIERKRFELNAKRLAVLEEHEEFMATLSHDLKNPVIAANRVLKLMADGAAGDINSEQANLFRHLIASNESLLLLINNLIEVYRYENNLYTLRLENVNLNLIIKACAESMTPWAETRAICMDLTGVQEVPSVKADSISVRRMIQNILDNAIKFSTDGGTIKIALQEQDGNITLAIADCGPGIPDAEKSNLFQRFKRGKLGLNHSTGTGLGLFICERIVQAHNGKIAIASEEGKGATFIVTLPIEQRTI